MDVSRRSDDQETGSPPPKLEEFDSFQGSAPPETAAYPRKARPKARETEEPPASHGILLLILAILGVGGGLLTWRMLRIARA